MLQGALTEVCLGRLGLTRRWPDRRRETMANQRSMAQVTVESILSITLKCFLLRTESHARS